VRTSTIRVIGSEVDVFVNGNVTTTGETNCPVTGAGRFDFRVTGILSLDELQRGGPWVFNAPTDAHLQLRITITGEWQLGDLYVS
jgi:hypothetical protein